MEDLDEEERRKLAEELGLDLEDLGLEAQEKDKVLLKKMDTFVESDVVTVNSSAKFKTTSPTNLVQNRTNSSEEHNATVPLLSTSLEKGASEDNRFE